MSDKSKYGVVMIPPGTVICNLEKGGDKENNARYRFSDTEKRTSEQIIKIITDEIVLPDLYGEPWIKIKQGWIKAEDKITWYDSYDKARKAYKSLTNYNRKLFTYLAIAITTAAAGYMIYKHKFTTHEVKLD